MCHLDRYARRFIIFKICFSLIANDENPFHIPFYQLYIYILVSVFMSFAHSDWIIWVFYNCFQIFHIVFSLFLYRACSLQIHVFRPLAIFHLLSRVFHFAKSNFNFDNSRLKCKIIYIYIHTQIDLHCLRSLPVRSSVILPHCALA